MRYWSMKSFHRSFFIIIIWLVVEPGAVFANPFGKEGPTEIEEASRASRSSVFIPVGTDLLLSSSGYLGKLFASNQMMDDRHIFINTIKDAAKWEHQTPGIVRDKKCSRGRRSKEKSLKHQTAI